MKKYISAFVLIFFLISNLSFASGRNIFTENKKKSLNSDGKRKIAKAILFSSALPGAGQYYNGSKIKALLFGAIEIACLASYFNYHNKGNDKKDEYRKFADQHYSYEQFKHNRDVISLYAYQNNTNLQDDPFDIFYEPNSGGAYNPGYFVIQGLEYDELDVVQNNIDWQHYYEDMGKYERYWLGWDDYGVFDEDGNRWYNENLSVTDGIYSHEYLQHFAGEIYASVGAAGENISQWAERLRAIPEDQLAYELLIPTPISRNHRDTYWAIRKKSIDNYDKARMFLNILVANHILSALEAGYSAHKKIQVSDNVRAQISVDPMFSYSGPVGARLSFRVNF
jgi:hypothetical protein